MISDRVLFGKTMEEDVPSCCNLGFSKFSFFGEICGRNNAIYIVPRNTQPNCEPKMAILPIFIRITGDKAVPTKRPIFSNPSNRVIVRALILTLISITKSKLVLDTNVQLIL